MGCSIRPLCKILGKKCTRGRVWFWNAPSFCVIFRLGLSQREYIFYLEVPNEVTYLQFTLPLWGMFLKPSKGGVGIQIEWPNASGVASIGQGEAECPLWQRKKCQKAGNKGKNREKGRKNGINGEKEEKSGRKGQHREGSFTLPPPLKNRAGYATAQWTFLCRI